MSTRRIFFCKKFKTLLCKIRKLVIAYNVTASNKTTHPREFFALCIGPNDSVTGFIVFKLSTKELVTTPKCKTKPMAEDIVEVVNEMGKQEGMPDGIQFHNIHHESTLSDLFPNKVGHGDYSCASDNNQQKRKNPELDLKSLIADVDMDDDGNDGLADNEDTADDEGQRKQDNQHDHFGSPIENKEQRNHFELLIKMRNFKILLSISIIRMMTMNDDDEANVVSEDLASTHSGPHDYYMYLPLYYHVNGFWQARTT